METVINGHTILSRVATKALLERSSKYLSPGTTNHFVQNWEDFQSSQDLDRELSIKIIINLPFYVLLSHGVQPDFFGEGADGDIVRELLGQHIAVGRWLEYYLLDRAELLGGVLKKREWKSYQFIAERTYNLFLLAQQVVAYLATNQNLLALPGDFAIPLPIYWVVLCEAEICQERLQACGYLGMPQKAGKRKIYELAKQHYDYLEDPQKIQYETELLEIDFRQLLWTLASRIAKQDSRFYNTHYLRAVRSQKKYYRLVMERAKKLVFTPNGLTEVGRGKGSRGKSKGEKRANVKLSNLIA